MPSERQFAVIGPLPSGTETRASLGCEIVDGVPQRAAPVVIAWLPDYVTSDAKLVSRLLREIAFVTQLHHPNVTRIIGLECFDEGWARVTEFVDGESAERLIEASMGTGLPARIAARIVADACEGVLYAHEHGQQSMASRPLVHGAIRPDTLLVGHDGVTRVTGFGSALIAGEAARARSAFLSPEQVIGGAAAVGTGTDVYGLGAVLYTMLTGKPPFIAFGDELESAILTGTPEKPALQGAAAGLLDVAIQALAKRSAQRYPSVAAMRSAIAGAMADEGLAPHGEVATFVENAVPADTEERQTRRTLLGSLGNIEEMTTLSRPASVPAGVDPALFEASRPPTGDSQRTSVPPPPQNGHADAAQLRTAPPRDEVTLVDGKPPVHRDETPSPSVEYPPIDASQAAESTDRIRRSRAARTDTGGTPLPPAARRSSVPPAHRASVPPSAWATQPEAPAPAPQQQQGLPQMARAPRPMAPPPNMGTVMDRSPVGQALQSQMPSRPAPAPVAAPGPHQTQQPLPAMPSMPPQYTSHQQMTPPQYASHQQMTPPQQVLPQPLMVPQQMTPVPMPMHPQSMPPHIGPQSIPPNMVHSIPPNMVHSVPPNMVQQGGVQMRGSLPPNGNRPSMPPGGARSSMPPPNARNSIGAPAGGPRSSMPPQPVNPVPRAPMRDVSAITEFKKNAGDSSRSVLYVGGALLLAAFVIIFALPSNPPAGLEETAEDTSRHKLPKELVEAALAGKADAPELPSNEPPIEETPAVPSGGPYVPEAELAPPPVTDGYLSLKTEPPVEVYDGSTLLGRTPFRVKLAVGKHKLRFTDRNKVLNLYKSYTIRPGGDHKDEISFGTSSLVVEAPDGAVISLNGKTLGRAPLDAQTIYEGKYLLKVVYEGKSWSETFDAPSGREIKYTVRMND